MPSNPPPPSPSHLLRTHSEPVNAVWFSKDNERLYSGDAQGHVVITSTRTLRSLASWKAHDDGILGLQEWDQHILTFVWVFSKFTLKIQCLLQIIGMAEITNSTYGRPWSILRQGFAKQPRNLTCLSQNWNIRWT